MIARVHQPHSAPRVSKLAVIAGTSHQPLIFLMYDHTDIDIIEMQGFTPSLVMSCFFSPFLPVLDMKGK